MTSNSKTKMSVDNVVFSGVSTIVNRQSVNPWVGTMSNLSTALTRVLSRKERALLPGSPAALRVVLNRVVNRLRNKGVSVRFLRTTDHTRTRLVRFSQ